MPHFICIHGHFYQPPRENPWLETIELQDSAYPFHDWNERINAECYARNATSRILDAQGNIKKIVNNYKKISFDVGPTLLAWMQLKAPHTYRAILTADLESAKQFSGHGSALAQAYNHMIMPLANRADKYTQAYWGLKDFEHRFGRKPEGMWLPETAVDLETLEILADLGIRFTLLSPFQAKRVRKRGDEEWGEVTGAQIDPSMAYEICLPSQRNFTLFFYDAPISRAVAFEGLLKKGEDFADRLLGGFNKARSQAQLVHIATDGESYGHHHLFGDMALSYALHTIEEKKLAPLTNYGEFLSAHPPTHEVEIYENTSWSCTHGIERWRSHCGCNTGHAGWNQEWRRPLREALDWLRDTLTPCYEQRAQKLLKDPADARNRYIEVILDRSENTLNRFFASHQTHPLTLQDQITTLKLLELQRHLMLMYTSCGWFFDEISGIETTQCLEYASRAIQLARQLFETDPEQDFLKKLEGAKSNIHEFKNGRRVYEKFVAPARVSLDKVMAHYAGTSIFETYEKTSRIYCYRIEQRDYKTWELGHSKLSMGQARVTSEITWESADFYSAVLYFGEYNLNGGVRPFDDWEAYTGLTKELKSAFDKSDFTQVLRLIDHHFGPRGFSLKSLFHDKQREILDKILKSTRDETRK